MNEYVTYWIFIKIYRIPFCNDLYYYDSLNSLKKLRGALLNHKARLIYLIRVFKLPYRRGK